jgi:hypothetical protein
VARHVKRVGEMALAGRRQLRWRGAFLGTRRRNRGAVHCCRHKPLHGKGRRDEAGGPITAADGGEPCAAVGAVFLAANTISGTQRAAIKIRRRSKKKLEDSDWEALPPTL